MNNLKLFIIASSIVVSIFPFIYTGQPYKENRLDYLSFEDLSIFLPLYYGISFVVINYLLKNIVINKQTRYLISGAILGFILSLIGHFVYKLPENLYKMENPNLVHIYGPLLYAFIFGVIVYYVDENI